MDSGTECSGAQHVVPLAEQQFVPFVVTDSGRTVSRMGNIHFLKVT